MIILAALLLLGILMITGHQIQPRRTGCDVFSVSVMTLSAVNIAAIEKALDFGFSDVAIARELGLKRSHTVFTHRRKIGFSQEQVIAARIRTWGSLVAGGSTIEEIAKVYGLTNPRTVQVQLWKAGFSWKTQSFAQLSIDQQEAIAHLVTKGKSDHEIAKQIGIKLFQVKLYRADH
jgi:hypothetical protein